MRLGRKSRDTDAVGERATALVVEASLPLDNAPLWGKTGRGVVRILIGSLPDPIYVAGGFKLDEEHWLVPGMEIPVLIDRQRPEQFEIDWDAIPGIEQRAAAGDPALADPMAAQRKVVDALRAAGLAGPVPGSNPGFVDEIVAAAQSTATPDRFKEALDQAARTPAPPGRLRAVAAIATITASIYERDVEGGGGFGRTSDGKRKAVLSVHVPGRPPYAVFMRKFKKPRTKGDISGAGLPALVSANDPRDVEILWKELPSIWDQVGQRISDGLAATQAQNAAIAEASAEATQRAIANPQPMAPRSPMEAMQELAPGFQQQMAQSAKQALSLIKDPAQRKMVIEQYRAAGIPVEDDE